MSFKRFRDCPSCGKRINWFRLRLYDSKDTWGIKCACGQSMGGWQGELPLKAKIVHRVKLWLDNLTNKYIIADLGDGQPTIVKQNRLIKSRWRVALRYFTRKQKRELLRGPNETVAL